MLDDLREAVGAGHVITDPGLRASYETDWTRRYHGEARAVVRPGSTDEAAAAVSACARAGAPLVPQGGNTGLVGGGVPRGGEVLVSTRRLDEIGPVDALAAQVTVGAGVVLGDLQRAARPHDLEVAVDFGARDSATIGGMAATNAGGVRAGRYGMMRAQVVGLEAVLADGSVVSRLSGLVKDNVGYDLPGLLCGSEGTLGLITRVRVRLAPRRGHRAAALVGLDSVAEAVAAARALRDRLGSLDALELMLDDGLRLVLEHRGEGSPLPRDRPAYLLVECAARGRDVTDELATALASLPEAREVAFAADGPARAALWALREGHTEAVNVDGPPRKQDVTLPPSRLAAFAAECRATVARRAPDARAVIFGHLGDGNLHVSVVGAVPDGPGLDEALLRLVAAHGGSVSAEHGIGVAKARYLGLGRSAADIRAMRAVKDALDPEGLLNPGVIFPR
jgi:FAD/FMN-containing dehydrogenase